MEFTRLLLPLVLALGLTAEARVRIPARPSPSPDSSGSDFSVTVGGERADVHQSGLSAYLAFESDGPVELEVRPKRGFGAATVRPLSAAVGTRTTEGVVAFRLPGPGQYVLDLDGGERSLLVFVNPWNDFEDDRRVATHAFGPGVHDVGLVDLRKGESVYLDPGAVVRGGFRLTNGVNDVRISGYGVIEGRPRAITASCANNLRMRGPLVADAPDWGVWLENCRGGMIENVKVVGSRKDGSGGLALVDCDVLTVCDSFVRARGDALALKGLGLVKGLGMRSASVSHCVLWSEAARAIGFGPESWGADIRDNLFEDCDILHCAVAAVGVRQGGMSAFRRNAFNGLRIEQQPGTAPFVLSVDNAPYPAEGFVSRDPKRPWLPELGDLSVRGLSVTKGEADPMPKVRLTSVTNAVRWGMITLSDLRINGRRAGSLAAFACETNAPAVRRLKIR